jgi:peptide deformylase
MALREILTQGDPVLTKTCRPVEKFDRKLHDLLDDLKETLSDSGGVGLAAPQIGILRRVVVVEDRDDHMLELVNPVIVSQEGEQNGWASACLENMEWSSGPAW